MAGPAHSLRLLLLAACLSPVAPAQTAVPPAPTPTVTEPPASPKLAKLFAGAPPKFDPPKPETSARDGVASPTDQPRNGIVRLPTYIVRDNIRLPDDYHMLTPQARQDAVVKRYVGEPGGLDVLLNKYTINNALWKKIPLLGRISDFGTASGPSMTPGDRIALDYSKIEAKRLYIEALGVSADIPPAPAKPKDEKSASVPAEK